MIILNVKPRTKEWLDLRKKKITSTDAAIINGSNTFRGNSPFKLWQKKMEIKDEEEQTAIMMEGNLLEEMARTWFNKKNKTNYQEKVILNSDYHWIMASLDGYDENQSDSILEIKCGEKTYDKATKGLVPTYYFDQIQHQLLASGKLTCYYVVYRPNKEPIVISIKRDQSHIEKLIEKEKDFFNCMIEMIPPALSESEFVEIHDEETIQLAKKWAETKENLKAAEELEKIARKFLLDQTDDGNCLIPNASVKIKRIIRKGSVDYEKLLSDLNIDKEILEKYRKPEVSWVQPTILEKEEEGY